MLVDENMIITGSKDHYIKVFEASRPNGMLQYTSTNPLIMTSMLPPPPPPTTPPSMTTNSVSPSTSSNNLMLNSKHNLTPPHYDGVQSLCLFDSYLFSCSRDMCIKKWSMLDFQCKQVNKNTKITLKKLF